MDWHLTERRFVQSFFMTLSQQLALPERWIRIHETFCARVRVYHVVISKQEKIILTSSSEKPVAELKPKHGKIRRDEHQEVQDDESHVEHEDTRTGHEEDERSTVDYRIQGILSSPKGRRCSKTISRQPGPPDTRASEKGKLVVTPNFQVIVPPQRKYAVQSFLSLCTPSGVLALASTHDVFFFRCVSTLQCLDSVSMTCRFISRDSLQKNIYRRSPAESVSQFASFEMCEVWAIRIVLIVRMVHD